MSKQPKIVIALCSVLLLFGVATLLFQNEVLPENKPADFNFVFTCSTQIINQLDTQKGTCMFGTPSQTTTLKLSDEEMNQIYSEMKKINILNYPHEFVEKKTNVHVTSPGIFTIKIIANGKEKTIHWRDNIHSTSQEAVQLRNLSDKIWQTVEGKEEYKKLFQNCTSLNQTPNIP